MDVSVAKLRPEHWPEVREIYQEGIEGGDATFEVDVPGWQEWSSDHLECPRLAAIVGEQVVGWAALSPVSSRCIYAGVAEVSVYVRRSHQGEGIGKRLLHELVDESERAGIWTLQAGVFPENKASLAIHEDCGFRHVGVRERLGQMHGRWRDVILLERRSDKI